MNRYAGVLLSVTSLPSKYGIGCFDKTAYDFVDFLEKSGQRYWQILPLGASSHSSFDSPYQAYSAFAGNPYLISLDDLIEEGVLTQEEVDAVDFGSDPAHVDYEKFSKNRLPLLHKAYERSNISQNVEYLIFCQENYWWLDDFALFMAVKEFFGGANWNTWPEDIRMHYGPALDYYNTKLYFDVDFHKYLQFKFAQQWFKLKKYANDKHIEIVGDIPIYVSPDGSDIWAQPDMFQLDEKNNLTQVAGCPPDSFSADGQVWGNPLYRWDRHAATGYHWWITRMWYAFKLYDVVRIDHFRGFDEYFCIPNGGTAKDGHWEKGPGMDLFNAIRNALGEKAVIAEDLGLMTDTVRKLVKDSTFPNMKVLQFGFDVADTGASNEYLPHNYESTNCVIYTGTHDNETISGWFAGLDKENRDHVRAYLCDEATPLKRIHKKLISTCMMCCAKDCIVPMQDWMGLDNSARMNVPGTTNINWSWRLLPGQITEELGEEMLATTKRYGRANWDALNANKKAEEKEETEAE